MDKQIKFSTNIFNLNSNINEILNYTDSNILLMYHLNGFLGNTFIEFCDINKTNKNFIRFISKNNFYVYCTTLEEQNYFETLKNWGVNIVNIRLGEKIFFDKKRKTVTEKIEVGHYRINKKWVHKYITEKRKEIFYIIKEQYQEFFMPKFDIAIMNPPYDGDLHISILKYVKSKSKKTINISPNWFYDYKKNYEIKPNTIQDLTYTESVNLFDGIQLQYPLAITTYEEDNNKFANTKKYVNEAYTLFSKIKLNTTLDDVNSKDYNGKGFFVPLKLMTSFWDNNKNFILDKLGVLSNGKTLNGNFYKDERRRNKNRPCGGIYQKTFNEAKNLADSFNTTFYVKWVKTFHTNTRYILTEYPYMDDYTKPWTNQRFCEYFFGKKDEKGNYLPNPGGFISDTQAIPGSEWDIILKS